jgi:hypothetical protein
MKGTINIKKTITFTIILSEAEAITLHNIFTCIVKETTIKEYKDFMHQIVPMLHESTYTDPI